MKFLTRYPQWKLFSNCRNPTLEQEKKICIDIITDAKNKAQLCYEKKFDQERYANLVIYAHEQGGYQCIERLSHFMITKINSYATHEELSDYIRSVVDGFYLESLFIKIPSTFKEMVKGKLNLYFLKNETATPSQNSAHLTK